MVRRSIDRLPGTYSLSPNSTDERIAVDVLFGRVAGTPLGRDSRGDRRLYQGLYLLQQLVGSAGR